MTIGALIKTAFANWRRRHEERKRLQVLADFLSGLDPHTRDDIRLIHDPL